LDRAPRSILEPVSDYYPGRPVLVNKPSTEPFPCIAFRDSQGRLTSKKSQSRATPCETIGDLGTPYSSMSGDPVDPHHMPGRDVVERLLTLMN